MRKINFRTFSYKILLITIFSSLFFSCASKPAIESEIEKNLEVPTEIIDSINKQQNQASKEIITNDSATDNNEYKIDELEEIEVIDEPIVIDFFPIEENSEQDKSEDAEKESSDDFTLEEKIEDFEDLLPIDNIEKKDNSIENTDFENKIDNENQLEQNNQNEENLLEITEKTSSTEQDFESQTEKTIEMYPIIEVEPEEKQTDDTINQSELELLYENIIPSRKITVNLGEKILITYPGVNWKFYGITDNSKDVDLIERNIIRTNTTFEFITKSSGIKILHFYKFDNVTQNYIDDFIEISIISENIEDEVFEVSTEEENLEKQKTVEAPRYKKVESAKKIGTKKQINDKIQNTDKPELENNNDKNIVQPEQNKSIDNTKEEQNQKSVIKQNNEINKAKKDTALVKEEIKKEEVKVQKKANILQNEKTDYVESKSKTEENPKLENEEESPSISKSEIDDFLISAKKLFNEKKYNDSLDKVNSYLELSTEKRDEALFLLGQLYESQSNVKNIKKALESYNSIISNYPSSKLWEDANKRIIYLNRFYLKGR